MRSCPMRARTTLRTICVGSLPETVTAVSVTFAFILPGTGLVFTADIPPAMPGVPIPVSVPMPGVMCGKTCTDAEHDAADAIFVDAEPLALTDASGAFESTPFAARSVDAEAEADARPVAFDAEVDALAFDPVVSRDGVSCLLQASTPP